MNKLVSRSFTDKPLTHTIYKYFQISPFSPALGAEVRSIDLSQGLTEAQFTELHQAFLEHQVLFFREQQEISPEVQIEIGKKFGKLHSHPAAPNMEGYPEIFVIHTHRHSKIANGEFWHSDVSCDEEPPLGTMLQLHLLPSIGGDTLFANMYQAKKPGQSLTHFFNLYQVRC